MLDNPDRRAALSRLTYAEDDEEPSTKIHFAEKEKENYCRLVPGRLPDSAPYRDTKGDGSFEDELALGPYVQQLPLPEATRVKRCSCCGVV